MPSRSSLTSTNPLLTATPGSPPANPAVSRKLTIGLGVWGPEDSPVPPAVPEMTGTLTGDSSSALPDPPPEGFRLTELTSNGPWIGRLFFGTLGGGGDPGL